MRKNFLFGLLAIWLAGFWLGGVSLADYTCSDEWVIACIGDVGYTSLQNAFTAWWNVVLKENVTITDENLILNVAAGKTVNLDLNGKTIEKNSQWTKYIIDVVHGWTLTIQDSSENKEWLIIRKNWMTAIRTKWTLNIEWGTITSEDWSAGYTIAIKVDESGVGTYWTLTVNWGILNWWQAVQSWWLATINWGILNWEANAWSYQYGWEPWNPGKIVINDWSTINGNVFSLQYNYYYWEYQWYPDVQSNVTINGWTINWIVSTQFRKWPEETVVDENPWEAVSAVIQISWWTFSNEPDASYIVEWKVAVQDENLYNIVNTYTVTFDANAAWVENPQSQTIPDWYYASQPTSPSNTWKVLLRWNLSSEEFDFTTPITSDITLVAQWGNMSDAAWDAEDHITYASWFVFEAEEWLSWADTQESVEAAVASSNATAVMEWVAELVVYSDEDDDWNLNVTTDTKINTKVNFQNPVAIRIPVNATGSVKVKVRHNGETTFGIEWLTRNSGDWCINWVADTPYDGSDIPVQAWWYVEIYTCSASTFVAYTETANPAPSYSGWWGGGGSSKSSTKNETTEDTTADTTDADTTWAEEWATEANSTVSAEEQAAVAKFWQEQIDAYKWALANGITTMKTVEAARLDQPLTRAELAKMMVVYIQKVAGKDPVVTWDVTYEDVDESLGDLAGYIKLAYQYQIMWINADGTPIQHFNPHGLVTRWEYATVFSRVLFGDRFNKAWADFYTNHLAALEKVGILKNTTPTIQEIRGWVMLMMYRSSQNSENIQALVAETEEAAAEETASEETAAEETATEETATEETPAEETPAEEAAE